MVNKDVYIKLITYMDGHKPLNITVPLISLHQSAEANDIKIQLNGKHQCRKFVMYID